MSQSDITYKISKQIQDINGDPSLTAQEKKKAIANLSGASRESMMDYLNKNFRTGPGLAPSIKKIISEHRPVGGPKKNK